MNFLGHLYLAGSSKEIRLGNFIADHIKGIPLSHYPESVARGIMMHRAIDYFTDSSDTLSECRALLRPAYRKYASVVLDVVLDYFLARNWNYFSPKPFQPFIYRFYLQLIEQWRWLPPYWRRLLPTFIRTNRIYRYRKIEGICASLDIMARSTSLPDASQFVRTIIHDHYSEMLPLVKLFIWEIVAEIRSTYGITPIGWALAKASAIKPDEYKEEDGESPEARPAIAEEW